VAKQVSESLDVPTIGIGAGPDCDGQVLVSNDAFGLNEGPVPSFARKFANLSEQISAAARTYIEDVRSQKFPDSDRNPD
jgi:3-methyl-2-oxobutanoate hydroxymethyltransferase